MTTAANAPTGHHDPLPPAPPAARAHVRAALGPALDGMLRPPPPQPVTMADPDGPRAAAWDPEDRRRWQTITAHRLHTDAAALHAAAHDLTFHGPLSAADAVAAVLARHVHPVFDSRAEDSLLHRAAGPLLAAWTAETAPPAGFTGLQRLAARFRPADQLVDTAAALGDLVAAGEWVRGAATAVELQADPHVCASWGLPPLDPDDPLLAPAGGPGLPPDPGTSPHR